MLKPMHRLRSKDEDESGTDIAEVAAEDQDETDLPDEELDDVGDEEGGEDEAAEEEGLVVTLGDEPEEDDDKKAPSWVTQLRKSDREKSKKIRELEEKLSGSAAPVADEIGKEPELEDFDYDADQFKAAYRDWTAKKAKVDQQKEQVRKQQEATAKEWQSVQETYAKGKARFPKEKMEEAEEEVVSTLNGPRQAMLMDMADDSATLVVALGSNPEVLRKLAGIKSDAKFIKELTKVEMQIKVASKGKTAPPPERTISGSGKTPGSSQASIDRLYEKAEKSGDYTEYYAAKSKSKGSK